MKMSENINETMRHLKFCYISILTNLLRTQMVGSNPTQANFL